MRGSVFVVSLLIVAGCGERSSTVTGRVTLDGRPLAGGTDVRAMIQFAPEKGGPTAVGTLDGNGEYQLSSGSNQGLPPGSYYVTVSASQLLRGPNPGDPASGRPITPRRYANAKESGLSADVKPGSNTFDFALVSNGGS